MIPTIMRFYCRALVLILQHGLFVPCVLREGNVEATWTSERTLIHRESSYFAYGGTKPQQNGKVTKVTFKWVIVIKPELGKSVNTEAM